MNSALMFLRLVGYLDVAHLKSNYKGTLVALPVLSGTNMVYPNGEIVNMDKNLEKVER